MILTPRYFPLRASQSSAAQCKNFSIIIEIVWEIIIVESTVIAGLQIT
jgi:hypothetical protein